MLDKDKQMAALIKINHITGFLSLDLDEMLQVISKELEELFYPYRVYYNLDNISCRAIKEQLPVIVYDPVTDPCGACQLNQHQAHICVPLSSGSEVLGTLSLRSQQPIKLERGQLELLLAIASQTAATIQRTRLFNRLQHEKEMLAQANRELKATQEQLILSERLAAVGQLAANFAHDINNPTGIVLSRLELMELEAAENRLPETVIKDLAVVKKHVKRIAKIARGLLTFSRQSHHQMSIVSVNELILEIVDWLEQQFDRKGIKFVLQLMDLPPIKGNREQLQQMLMNIFNNARDAQPQGGEIKVTTASDAEAVTMVISDRGTGIAAAHHNKIFNPFFTTKEVGKGTGLGLSICYKIIQDHGGNITVQSSEGKGTTFTIKLPINIKGDVNCPENEKF
jgi:signal transduction histidine kinase